MAKVSNKTRYTPLEVSQMLKISPAKFNQLVMENEIPKGRIGEDNRRYYTDQDVEFIVREWRSRTTAHFLMYTFPLILALIVLFLVTLREISQSIHDSSAATPTPRVGFGSMPRDLWVPGSPMPKPDSTHAIQSNETEKEPIITPIPTYPLDE